MPLSSRASLWASCSGPRAQGPRGPGSWHGNSVVVTLFGVGTSLFAWFFGMFLDVFGEIQGSWEATGRSLWFCHRVFRNQGSFFVATLPFKPWQMVWPLSNGCQWLSYRHLAWTNLMFCTNLAVRRPSVQQVQKREAQVHPNFDVEILILMLKSERFWMSVWILCNSQWTSEASLDYLMSLDTDSPRPRWSS